MPFCRIFQTILIYKSILVSSCLTGAALGSLNLLDLLLNAGKLGINHDTAAVLANDDFLAHADIKLTLWRNLVKATAARLALYINDTQTVTCIVADTLE